MNRTHSVREEKQRNNKTQQQQKSKILAELTAKDEVEQLQRFFWVLLLREIYIVVQIKIKAEQTHRHQHYITNKT